jgi:hypothetical protein
MALIDTHPNLVAIGLERAAVFNRLNTFQAARRIIRGRYVQLLLSPAAERDGTLRQAFITRQVGDEIDGWPTIDEAGGGGLRCQYYTHRHDHPDGSHSYTLGCRLVWNGREFVYEALNGVDGAWQEIEAK